MTFLAATVKPFAEQVRRLGNNEQSPLGTAEEVSQFPLHDREVGPTRVPEPNVRRASENRVAQAMNDVNLASILAIDLRRHDISRKLAAYRNPVRNKGAHPVRMVTV